MTTWTPTVKKIVDNIDRVSGTVVNPIVDALAARDQYLFERIDSYEDKAVLMAYNVPVGTIAEGDVVYYKSKDSNGNQQIEKAIGGFSVSVDPSHVVPAESSFVFGIVKTVYGDSADVYLRGLISSVDLETLLDEDSKKDYAAGKTTGLLYLSTLNAGKLSFNAGGASVYVGTFVGDGNLFLAPNTDSLNQMYFNYRVSLVPKVLGTATQTGDTWSTVNTDADLLKVGWIAATFAESKYGIIAPTGAKFYYNVPNTAAIKADSSLTAQQLKDSLLLKNALPAHPSAYTMLFMNGVLQTQNDADHTDGAYLLSGINLWWFDDSDTYKPWTAGANVVNMLLQTTKLNPFYKASVVSSLNTYNDVTTNNTGKVLSFIDATTGEESTSGDLVAKLTLPVVTNAETTATATFVKSIEFDQVNGRFNVATSPGVVSVNSGPGIKAVTTDGVVTLSLQNFALSGTVEDLEPEESDFAYRGLHSYLRMKNPAAGQRVGFVGKLLLPEILPINTPLNISLLAFGEGEMPGVDVNFIFEYVVSQPGSISAVVNKANGGAAIKIKGFVKDTAQMVGGATSFQIPYSVLAPQAYVNFRIARVNSSYTSNIDVLGVYWAIK